MIRKAISWDLNQISNLENAIFTDGWSKHSFQAALDMEDTLFLVAEEREIILGYALLYKAADEADITNVAVAPKQRRKGYGKSLVLSLISQGCKQGITSYFLEVRQGNEPARKMYESLGFNQVGVRKNYYDNPTEDAIIMKYEVGE